MGIEYTYVKKTAVVKLCNETVILIRILLRQAEHTELDKIQKPITEGCQYQPLNCLYFQPFEGKSCLFRAFRVTRCCHSARDINRLYTRIPTNRFNTILRFISLNQISSYLPFLQSCNTPYLKSFLIWQIILFDRTLYSTA